MTDIELFLKIDQVTENYTGQLDDLNAVVGLFITGRLYGWKVQRIALPRRIWTLAIKLIGDPKEILPEYGVYSDKSLALQIVKNTGKYWEIVMGAVRSADISSQQRKAIL